MITVNARGFAGSINQRMMTTNVQDIHNNLLRFFASEATGAVSNWWSSMRGGYMAACRYTDTGFASTGITVLKKC